MDAVDLIARENEFKRLNKQLEKKTESLMKEIEHAMQNKDIFSEFSSNLTLTPTHKTKRHNCETQKPTSIPETPKAMNKTIQKADKLGIRESVSDNCVEGKVTINNCNCCFLSNNKHNNNYSEFLYAFVSINVKDNILPQSFVKEKVTVENVCKFLVAKIKLMQEQIDRLQGTIDKKAKQCDTHMTHVAELESERLSLLNRANTMRAETSDAKAKHAVLQNKFDEKDRLYKEQRSVTDKLTSELKGLKTKNISLEARCASQEETISNLKHQLETAKMTEKEYRESTRSLATSHQNAITRLENKLKTLQTHSEKQSLLIENLRKQNALILTDGAVRALEKDYCDFLKQDL